MKKIKLLNLLKKVLKYDFYDWELGEENKNSIIVGMPNDLLNKLHFPDFYDSMGFDAVNNPYAQLSLSSMEWLNLEKEFFNWFKEVENILFSKKELIVTPELERNWWIDEEVDSNSWIMAEYEAYLSLLKKYGMIESSPSLKEPYRGGEIESFDEFILLAKMSIRGVPLLFLNDEDTIIRILDYLTIQIFFRNKEMLEKKKAQLVEEFDAQILVQFSV
ncbi:hypothetical protein [Rummeliibacillus suwonensis]|uniref:hypothetical protein n=1 Tax=Rummeliibacillus suwonensis TaxID=1306154 RepID=UPI0011B65FC0|nr:hypothetical protein [Rummeliibacillus suwonensis]